MELEILLTPVSGENPCGEDLSFSPEFDSIQDARRADDPSLDQGEWITELKTADWPFVVESCGRLLATRSKDLRLAVWWCEASTRTGGFPGLAQGLELVAGLCERYWDGMHPLPEDGDHEQRVGNLAWLLSGATRWSREVAIVSAAGSAFAFADFEVARQRAAQSARDGASDQDDGTRRPTLEHLEKVRRDTSHTFYLQVSTAMRDCTRGLDRLERVVDGRLGEDGPSFSALRDVLADVGSQVGRFAAEAGVDGEAVAASAGDGLAWTAMGRSPAEAGQVAAAAGDGPIGDRREALVQLRRVAEFFRRTEPHSPVAYLAEKAARWGDMPLHVWLRSVVKDEAALAQLNEMLDVADAGEAMP